MVIIVGALGFAYVTHLNSQMASTHTAKKTGTTTAQLPSVAAPTTIATTDDLDASLSTLDATRVDDNGSDLETLVETTSDF